MDSNGNGGIFSMFPLSKRNFRTTSYDGSTIKVDKFRGDHVLLHKVLVLYCTVLYCTVLYCTVLIFMLAHTYF